MDAGLGLEQPIGPGAAHGHDRLADPGLVAALAVVEVNVELAPVGPAQQHAQQHLRPVLAVGATRPGLDADDRVALVVLARQQHADLKIGEVALELV